MARSRFEPPATFTDWEAEARNALRKHRREPGRWHLVAEGRRYYSRTVAAQLRAGRIKALAAGEWEVRYVATDDPQKFTLYIRPAQPALD